MMTAPCTCPGGQHDGRFPYCSGTSGGPIVIERGGTDWAQIIDPRDARVAELEREVARLRESEPLTYRGQRDAALREVARLEALIVGWHNEGGEEYMALYDEAERIIRSRKP